jgi:hypothetical protein
MSPSISRAYIPVSRPDLVKLLLPHFDGEREGNHEIPQDSWCLRLDSNQTPHEYEPQALLLLHPPRLDNIKINLKGIECEGVDSIHLARVQWQTIVNTAMNLRVANKGQEFLE